MSQLMTRLRARRDGNRWVLSAERELADVLAEISEQPLQFSANPDIAMWELELLKARYALSVAQISAINAFCAHCREFSNQPHEALLEGPPTLVKQAASYALNGVPSPVAGWRLLLALMVATPLALCATLWAAISLATEGAKVRLQHAPALPFIHGELSTRTRHLLRCLTQANYTGDVVVVGRPRQSLTSLERQIRAEFGLRVRLRRCFRSQDVLRAFGQTPRLLHAALQQTIPAKPDLRELAGAMTRMFLGHAAVHCWRRQSLSLSRAVYGHTGTADISMLERVQQSAGCLTTHYVHGVSHGANFVAFSSVGIFQCAHDAAWHRRLGGYGCAIALPSSRPSKMSVVATPTWVVLSNIIHPMNASYRANGARDELRFISLVSDAISIGAARPGALLWRAHPIFDAQPTTVRDKIARALTAAGFQMWPAARHRSDLSDIELAISSPSTAAIDFLRAGVPTFICALEPTAKGSVYEVFPQAGTDASHMAECLARPLDEAFEQTWTRVGPSAAPTWAQLLKRDLIDEPT